MDETYNHLTVPEEDDILSKHDDFVDEVEQQIESEIAVEQKKEQRVFKLDVYVLC
jgi:hypothetical protein